MNTAPLARPPVLVTGVAGYIGAQVARALRDIGRRVIGVDNLSTGSRGDVPHGIEFVESDIGDEDEMWRILRLRRVEEVIHLAAYVDVADSVGYPSKYHENNAEKTQRLLTAARQAGVTSFIFSSTAAVYGNPDIVPVLEDAALRPISPYGESKLEAERIIQSFASDNFRYAILRYFNVAGVDPDERGGYRTDIQSSHLIRNAVRAVLGLQEHFDIFGTDYPTPDGTCIRDFIHVADVADAHLATLRYLEDGGESDIFNIGTGRGYSVLEVKEMVEKVSGQLVLSQPAARRSGDPVALVANADKIRKLGWRPRYDLEVMVKHELRFVNSHSPALAHMK